MWTTDNLKNESDVEQKFIYPFLIEAKPLGLGLPTAVVQTKANIRRLAIGKGAEQKLYFPDYLVVSIGYPLLVIEAKHPAESAEEGFREARLYAAELSALYNHNITPAKFVIACNGVELHYGYADQARPVGVAQCASLGPYAQAIAEIIDLMAWDKLHAEAVTLARRTRPLELFKPRRRLGGIGLQNEEVGINTFGATLTTIISPIFNPSSAEERAEIARHAYIPSKRRERYVDPIDRVIRAAKPPSEVDAKELEDTAKPTEVIGQLKAPRSLEHKVLLLIGSVGSGKSTFIDHLIEVALPKELLSSTVWCRLNMNAAPVSNLEIYAWLREELIAACKRSVPTEDFDDLSVIQKVFSTEIRRFKKGVGSLYERNSEIYAIKLGEYIEEQQRDQRIATNAYVRFTCAERGRLLIIVLDNCDKKSRDEQLLMFEAAQWLQKEYRCLVILPLRDETYDNHRDQPPLDTALKDLVFRIEPPLFQQVLLRRLHFALQHMAPTQGDKLHFELPNGFQVEYPQSDQAYYLTSIVKSLFEHDRFARRMIVGLAGRNMRRALEIFLEFCNSGHIGEDQIFRMRQSFGRYTLPQHQVATVLLRMNRRFYDSDYSYIKNIFAANKDDALPAFFCRYMILNWLRWNFSSSGTSGLRGYFPKRDIKHALVPYGLDTDSLDREFNYLLAAQCVIAEHLRVESVADDDLVRLGPAGFVHLELLANVNYLAAVAEDTFFSDRRQAERVVDRIKSIESQMHINSIAANAHEVVEYLESARGRLLPPGGPFVETDLFGRLTSMQVSRDALTRLDKSHATDPWFEADRRILKDENYFATIANTVSFGYFAEFDDGLVGLIHTSNSADLSPANGDRVEVRVNWIDVVQRKIGLRLVRIVEEDVGDLVSGVHGTLQQSSPTV
jgi:hypothetical protein